MEFDEARKPHDPDDVRGGGGLGGGPGHIAQEQWRDKTAREQAARESAKGDAPGSIDPGYEGRPAE